LGQESRIGEHDAALVGVVGVGHPNEVGFACEEAVYIEAVESYGGVVEAGEIDYVDVRGSFAEVADFGGGDGGAGWERGDEVICDVGHHRLPIGCW
jgi:hypothetical protein